MDLFHTTESNESMWIVDSGYIDGWMDRHKKKHKVRFFCPASKVYMRILGPGEILGWTEKLSR
jgi:hypothetical protein